MKFGDKLRKQRKERRMKQAELAAALGVTVLTIGNYENGVSHPQDRKIYFKLAELFGVDVNYFLTEDEEFLTFVAEKYGSRGQKQAQEVLAQAAALFAGGELSETDKLGFMHDIQAIYLDASQRAKDKYTPNKFKNQS